MHYAHHWLIVLFVHDSIAVRIHDSTEKWCAQEAHQNMYANSQKVFYLPKNVVCCFVYVDIIYFAWTQTFFSIQQKKTNKEHEGFTYMAIECTNTNIVCRIRLMLILYCFCIVFVAVEVFKCLLAPVTYIYSVPRWLYWHIQRACKWEDFSLELKLFAVHVLYYIRVIIYSSIHKHSTAASGALYLCE